MSVIKPTIQNSEGVIVGEEVHIEGDIVIAGGQPDPARQAEEARSLGVDALTRRSYREAAGHLERVLELTQGEPKDYYHLALAGLGGRRPRKLSPSELKAIETRAALAVERAPQVEHLLLWAFLKFDFYAVNGLRTSEPGWETLMQRAWDQGPNPEPLRRLLEWLPPSDDNPVYRAVHQRAHEI